MDRPEGLSREISLRAFPLPDDQPDTPRVSLEGSRVCSTASAKSYDSPRAVLDRQRREAAAALLTDRTDRMDDAAVVIDPVPRVRHPSLEMQQVLRRRAGQRVPAPTLESLRATQGALPAPMEPMRPPVGISPFQWAQHRQSLEKAADPTIRRASTRSMSGESSGSDRPRYVRGMERAPPSRLSDSTSASASASASADPTSMPCPARIVRALSSDVRQAAIRRVSEEDAAAMAAAQASASEDGTSHQGSEGHRRSQESDRTGTPRRSLENRRQRMAQTEPTIDEPAIPDVDSEKEHPSLRAKSGADILWYKEPVARAGSNAQTVIPVMFSPDSQDWMSDAPRRPSHQSVRSRQSDDEMRRPSVTIVLQQSTAAHSEPILRPPAPQVIVGQGSGQLASTSPSQDLHTLSAPSVLPPTVNSASAPDPADRARCCTGLTFERAMHSIATSAATILGGVGVTLAACNCCTKEDAGAAHGGATTGDEHSHMLSTGFFHM